MIGNHNSEDPFVKRFAASVERLQMVALTQATILTRLAPSDWTLTSDEDLLKNSDPLLIESCRADGYDTSKLTNYITEYSAWVKHCHIKVDCHNFPNFARLTYGASIKLDKAGTKPVQFHFRYNEAEDLFNRVQGIIVPSEYGPDLGRSPTELYSDSRKLELLLDNME